MMHPRLDRSQRGRLWLRLVIRLSMIALGLLALMRLVPPLFSLFAPFLLALLCAALLDPAVRWLQRRLGLGRQVLSLFLLVVLVALLGGLLAVLLYSAGRELASLAQNWDVLLAAFQDAGAQMDLLFQRFWDLVPPALTASIDALIDQLVVWLQTVVPGMLKSVAERAGDAAMGVPSFLLALLMFVLALYFLTADYPYLRTRAISHMDDTLLRFLRQVKQTALTAFGGYIRAQVLLSVAVFFILLIGFMITRQNYGLLLALGLAVLDFIPIVGSGTVMVPWAVIALFTQDYPTAIEMMVIWGVIAMFRRVMEPKFVGNQTGLSPILSLISIYVGMKVAGIMGMILGPIVTLVVLNLAGLGLFQGLRADLAAAVRDIDGLLRERPERGDH